MRAINRESFDGKTVEVTLAGVTKRLDAVMIDGLLVTRGGLGGKYLTGSKVWRANIVQWADGTEHANFGRDDRSGKFNKLRGVFFTA